MPSDERVSGSCIALRPFTAPRCTGEPSDAQLLGRFVDQWDQSAFQEVVLRHGPMVLGVCRRVLRDAHAADDAFQATFLLLVRRAGSVRNRESVGPWLHVVAQRVALQARRIAARRRAPDCSDAEVPTIEDDGTLERAEQHLILHQELSRLPEKYRAPLVLCYIEGFAHEAVAQRLGWPIGTVRSRIARGRDLLGARLLRRGLTPAAVLLALSLLPKTARAVPVRLVQATVRAATCVAAGHDGAPRGDVSLRVAQLEREVMKTMRRIALKWATAFALAAVVSGAALAVFVPRVLAAAEDADKAKAELKKLQGTWISLSSEENGRANEQAAENPVRISFEGETFTLTIDGKFRSKGLIKLNPTEGPIELDLQFQEGNDQGKTALAIYAWDGKNLKICGARPGAGERPNAFATAPGDERVLATFGRQVP